MIATINLRREAMDEDDSIEMNSSYWFSVAALIICLLEVVLVSIYLKYHFMNKTLDKESTKDRCGYIFEELNYKIRGGWTLAYPILY